MHEERRSGPAQPLPSRSEGLPRAALPADPALLPALPEVFRRTIEAGCAAWAVDLDEPLMAALEGHARLLLAWTAAINLTSVREPEGIAVAHVLDSLSAVPLLRRVAPSRPRLLDLGSGGGYPGLTLAAALPAGETVLVESVAKKVRFLEVAAVAVMAPLAQERRPQVRVDHRRAETLAGDAAAGAHFDVVTARAVGSLTELARLALPLLRGGGVLVAWKSDAGDGRLASEVAAARPVVDGLGGGRPWIEELPPGVGGLERHRLVVVRRSPGGPRRLLG